MAGAVDGHPASQPAVSAGTADDVGPSVGRSSGDDEGCGAAAAAAASGTDDIDSTSTDDELQQKDALDST